MVSVPPRHLCREAFSYSAEGPRSELDIARNACFGGCQKRRILARAHELVGEGDVAEKLPWAVLKEIYVHLHDWFWLLASNPSSSCHNIDFQ